MRENGWKNIWHGLNDCENMCVCEREICQRCNPSAMSHPICCPCKQRSMSVSLKMHLISDWIWLTLLLSPSLSLSPLLPPCISLFSQVMVGWSYFWFCGAWISLSPALATASATPHPAPSPARPTTSMLCPRVSPLKVSGSSCKTTRSRGSSKATSRPLPPCCGFTLTTSHTYNHPHFTALTAWRSLTSGTTSTWRPLLQTPSWAWVGYMPYICTTVAWSPCPRGSLRAYIISSISTYRCLRGSCLLSNCILHLQPQLHDVVMYPSSCFRTYC